MSLRKRANGWRQTWLPTFRKSVQVLYKGDEDWGGKKCATNSVGRGQKGGGGGRSRHSPGEQSQWVLMLCHSPRPLEPPHHRPTQVTGLQPSQSVEVSRLGWLDWLGSETFAVYLLFKAQLWVQRRQWRSHTFRKGASCSHPTPRYSLACWHFVMSRETDPSE